MRNHNTEGQPKRRRIEREFGVPFPGEIVDESRWTKTALKEMSGGVLLNWSEAFRRDAPKVLDLGCGNGRHLIGSAVWRPDHDHLGVDILPVVIRYATRRANQRGLTNIRFAVIGGRELLGAHIEPHTITEIHCYHPQPYYTPEEYPKRLINPEFLALVYRSLIPSGQFFVQTDNPSYWRYMQTVIPHFFEFEDRDTCWPDAPKGRTRREIIALRHGLPIYRGIGKPKGTLHDREMARLVATLPAPKFESDRLSRQLVDWDDEYGRLGR